MRKKLLQRVIIRAFGIGISIVSLGIHAQTTGTWYLNGSTSPSTTSTISPFALKWGMGSGTVPEAWSDIFFAPPFNGPDQKGFLLTKQIQNNYISAVPPTMPIPSHIIVSFLPSGTYTTATPPLPGICPIIAGVNSKVEPLFWLRGQAAPVSMGGGVTFPGYDETKFMVMPNGNTGINNATPRAALDVISTAGVNQPCAIFGVPSTSTTVSTSGESIPGVTYALTRHLEYVPNLDVAGYNNISQPGDHGLFFSDGAGSNGTNGSSSLVIAPWSNSNGVGGLRMDANGNIEVRGNIRSNLVKVDAQWWPDFVFDANYKLPSLDSVSRYISVNKHLPGMPTQDSITSGGQDIGSLQKLQQQKIEELTLYIIQQRAALDAQSKKLAELETELKKVTK